MPKPTIPLGHPDFMVRFWSKVDKISGPMHPTLGRCWVWTGGRFRFGYGKVCSAKKKLLAHRLAWKDFAGAIPDGLCVLHNCDNPPCVNPAHLFLGTQADNNADRDAKGRQVALRGDRHHLRVNPEQIIRGESHGRSKLTDAKVRAIRLAIGSHVMVGREFGVSESTIALIRKGRIWSHVR